MMEVGFSEILLISVLALIVLGPEKLPKVAAEIGRWVGRARAMARQFRDQLEDEASLETVSTKRKAPPPAASPDSATQAANPTESSDAAITTTPVTNTVGEPATASEAQAFANNHGAGEFPLDHAESTPHPPMIDDYVVDHEAEDAAKLAATEAPQPERVPRL